MATSNCGHTRWHNQTKENIMQIRTLLTSLIAMSFMQTAALADYFADFSKGEVRADFPVRTEGCDNNPYYKGSYRLLRPNRSFIEGTFQISSKPKRVLLTLKHLSSYNRGSKLSGESPISIIVNGNAVVKRFDPGSHGYVKDSFEITKYLNKGDNTLRIQYGNGTTHYWIKWLLIETD
jgi:hypothetical protein